MNRRKFFGNAAAGAIAAPEVGRQLANVAKRNIYEKEAKTVASGIPDPRYTLYHERTKALVNRNAAREFYRSGGQSWCSYPDIDELRSVSPAVKRIWKADRWRKEATESHSLIEQIRKSIFGDSIEASGMLDDLPRWMKDSLP